MNMDKIKQTEGELIVRDARVAIVAARFNDFIVESLLKGAVDCLLRHGASESDIEIVRTPGAFEMPLIVDKIAAAVQMRLEVADREMVRRGAALFALPQHAATGSKLIWETSDRIWRALGDTSEDFNWYTKRMTLSGVYSATVLFWLGDDSEGHEATWAFLDRRIDNVMQIEKFKAQMRNNRLLSKMMAGPNMILSNIRAPQNRGFRDLPGHVSADQDPQK